MMILMRFRKTCRIISMRLHHVARSHIYHDHCHTHIQIWSFWLQPTCVGWAWEPTRMSPSGYTAWWLHGLVLNSPAERKSQVLLCKCFLNRIFRGPYHNSSLFLLLLAGTLQGWGHWHQNISYEGRLVPWTCMTQL